MAMTLMTCGLFSATSALARQTSGATHLVRNPAAIFAKATSYREPRSSGALISPVAASLRANGRLSVGSVPTIVVSPLALHCLGTMGGPPSLGPRATLAGLQCLSLARPPIVPSKAANKSKRSKKPSVSPQVLAKLAVDRAIALAGNPGLQLAPARIGLTGLDTYFWVAPRPRP
ncbi:MAG: hypothetical protein M3P01_05250, partial [Actinomycetota bacterium]|nr:hypothetical protein [Actinomycetota bacterium]